MSSWVGLGLMSGSSLDGVDICCVEFAGDFNADFWSHRILKATTVKYSAEWVARLKGAPDLPGLDLLLLDREYAHLLGQMVQDFLDDNPDLSPNFVASHGHTLFHQPDRRLTYQAGDGETLVSRLTCPLVTNFRNKDVALGGQGAPLVPVGESYLFNQFDACINLGGIANMTVKELGFDIGPCNMLLNHLASRSDLGLEYDEDGKVAASGHVIHPLLKSLNALPYYQHEPPKSLGLEWFQEHVLVLLQDKTHSTPDLLRTAVEHIAHQVAAQIERHLPLCEGDSLLITGGGALNCFLMSTLKQRLAACDVTANVTECDEETINFKEALIFAFLGLRALLGLPNVSQTVTGASTDSVSGSIHLPPTSNPLGSGVVQDYTFHFRKRQHSMSEACYTPAIKDRRDSVLSADSEGREVDMK